MDVSSVVNIANNLASQRNYAQQSVEAVKLAKESYEATGQGALQLIEGVRKPHGSLGHNINTTA